MQLSHVNGSNLGWEGGKTVWLEGLNEGFERENEKGTNISLRS